ncbi:transporter substrate-binding domain-containing protein [Pontiella sp.]|uniref:transporter substrate-binding domain-containing protein n=1 Tax=Pontiella sp. TaxID=2837462 RepID=UPI0035653754
MKSCSKTIVLAGGILWALLSPVLAAEPLRAAVTPAGLPFATVDADGRADGFSVELLQAVVERMGREVAFRPGIWTEMRSELADGTLDVLPLVGRTPERKELFDFSVPYLTQYGALFVRDDNTQIHGMADVKEKRVGVLTDGVTYEYALRTRVSEQLVPCATTEEAFQRLADGEIDAVIAMKQLGVVLLRKLGLQNIQVVGEPVDEFKLEVCFAVKKGNDELLALLNEGLAKMLANGSLRRLSAKWLGLSELEAARARVLVYSGDMDYRPTSFWMPTAGRAVSTSIWRGRSPATGVWSFTSSFCFRSSKRPLNMA